MNKLILMGRLTRDPEIRYSQGEKPTAYAKYTLAVNRRQRRQDEVEADFFPCLAFGKSAEFAEKYFTQGTKLLVTGRIQNNNYTNREGQKVYGINVIIEEQEFAESKKASGTAPTEATAEQDRFMELPDGIGEEFPFS